MRRIVLFVKIIACCFVFNSCEIDNGVNFRFATLPVVDVDLPASFQLHEHYEITVTYSRPDDCTFFEGFDIVKQDLTTRNVVVIGSVITDRECTPNMEEVQASFNFEVLYDQPYMFRFWQGEDENGDPKFLEIEVPITL